MTPALLALAISAKEKKAKMAEEENKTFKATKTKTTYVIKDYEPFTSPVTGEVIGGRAQLRDHLKATNCRIVEPSESRARQVPKQT